MALRPVVFLDRDGTLNVEAGYIRDLANLNLIDGAGEAVRLMNEAGLACILTTNQTGAARGYYPESHILDLNNRLLKLLADAGARLDAVYYCPHLSPEEGGQVIPFNIACDCRKPATGLVEQAFREHPDLDRQLSFVVGDKATDVELARNCAARGVLVETGYGKEVLAGTYQWKVEPDFQAGSIVEAANWIIEQVKSSAKKPALEA
ncbi:MAG: HAD family hydrolase [Candidatus Obscuribacter sp.]|nr:HAD family hydrolase [Candidatus Obscuribacter sp.]